MRRDVAFAFCCKVNILKLSKNKIVRKVIKIDMSPSSYKMTAFLFYKSKNQQKIIVLAKQKRYNNDTKKGK